MFKSKNFPIAEDQPRTIFPLRSERLQRKNYAKKEFSRMSQSDVRESLCAIQKYPSALPRDISVWCC